jgi:folate-binding protein YgfZ
MKPDRYIAMPGRAVISISGADSKPFLQGLVTNDVDFVAPDRAIYAALLTPQGKFLHDFFIAELDGRLLLDCAAARLADLLKRLTMYRLRSKVEIRDESGSWQVWALLPGGGTAGAAGARRGGIVFTDPRHAALGHRAILPADTKMSDSGLAPGAFEEYETLRIGLGIPAADIDLLAEKSLPLEYGFDELHGVSFEKGCYVGQEVTARMKHRDLVKKRLFPVDTDGAVSPGTPVMAGAVEAGEIRSALDGRATALLRLDLAERDDLAADGVPVRAHKPDWASF